MQSFTFRMTPEDQHNLNAIVKAMQGSTGVDLTKSDVVRMLLREGGRRHQTYGAHALGDIVCARNHLGRAVVSGVNHDWVVISPDGFEWGYYGQGPRDLALNILLRATGSRDFAFRHHFRYCEEVVAQIPHLGGTLRSAEILEWVARFRDEDRVREAVQLRDRPAAA